METHAAAGADEADLNLGPVAPPRHTRLRPPRKRTRKGTAVNQAQAADNYEQAAG